MALVSIFLLNLFGGDFYSSFQLKTFDWAFRQRGVQHQAPEILFVEMDQHAIETLGRWPWPRQTFARIIETLGQLGAKQILFDVLFTEPQQLTVDGDFVQEGVGFQRGKAAIQDFIAQASGLVSGGTATPEESVAYLGQISSALDQIESDVQRTLNEAVRNDDAILSRAVASSGNVYLGNRMQVIYTEEDLARHRAYLALKAHLAKALIDDPTLDQEGLLAVAGAYPAYSRLFDTEELERIARRFRIRNFLIRDLSVPLEALAYHLGETPDEELRSDLGWVRHELLTEKIRPLLEANPNAEVTEIMWTLQDADESLFNYMMTDPSSDHTLGVVYEAVRKKQIFLKRFGIQGELAVDSPYVSIDLDAPMVLFSKVCAGSGYLNAVPDSDGVIRRVPLFLNYEGYAVPQLAMGALMDYLSVDRTRVRASKGEGFVLPSARLPNEVQPRDLFIPTDSMGCLMINWADDWGPGFAHLSCAAVYRLWEMQQNVTHNQNLLREEGSGQIQEQLAQDRLVLRQLRTRLGPIVEGKICIVGLTAPGTHDYGPIPLASNYPVVGTHANLLNTILTESFLGEAGPKEQFAWAALWVLLAVLLLPRLSAFQGLGFVTSLSVASVFSSLLIFKSHGLWIDALNPLIGLGLTFVGVTSYSFMTEEKEKRFIKKAFGHYVSGNVMEEILSDPSKLNLGGARKNLTVLFSDVRGFTTISEQMSPEEVVLLLNEYLDEMTQIIFRNNGTLDKYVGDEIMAVFGAPSVEEVKNHAELAVRTALQMVERLKELQIQWSAAGRHVLDMGIGINTGEMIVGNMGSKSLMDYTVIGDAVNLGARVEALTRGFDCHIIITEFTLADVENLVEVEYLDSVQVKGKSQFVKVYKLLGLKQD
ncbi:MAG: adenylate/guanylate cyclase domain-containing protein [Candidatus Omnitrophica bacterium]|nr:adenylate/guanylate cyclase domain-containing protein [Candidatus Omnitrophota bacterium]